MSKEFDQGYNMALTEISDFLDSAIEKYGWMENFSDGDINGSIISQAMIVFCRKLRDLVESKKKTIEDGNTD